VRSGGPIHEAAQLIDNCAGGHAVGDPVEAEVAQAVVQVVTGEDVGYEVTAVGARVVCVVLVGAVAFALTLIADLIAVLQHQCDNVIHQCLRLDLSDRRQLVALNAAGGAVKPLIGLARVGVNAVNNDLLAFG